MERVTQIAFNLLANRVEIRMNLTTLGRRLKFARKRKGLTQQELGDMADTTQGVIQQIENGKILRPRNIDKIAKALEVSPSWLQFGDNKIDKLDEATLNLALEISDLPEAQRAVLKATIDAMKK